MHEIERRASPQGGPIEEEEEEEEKREKEGEEESAAEAEKHDDFFVDDAEADANAEEVHEVEAPLSVSSCNVFTQTCTESHHAAQMFMMSSAEDAPETVTDASHSIWALVAFALVVGVALSSRSSGASPEEEEEETKQKSKANVPTIVAATATASMRRVETPSKVGVDSSAKYVHPNAYKAGNKENVHTPAVQSRRELVSKSGEKSVAVPKWAARMVMGAGSSALVSNSGRKKEQIPSWARRMVVHKKKSESGKSAKKKAGEVASSILAATASPSASSSMR